VVPQAPRQPARSAIRAMKRADNKKSIPHPFLIAV